VAGYYSWKIAPGVGGLPINFHITWANWRDSLVGSRAISKATGLVGLVPTRYVTSGRPVSVLQNNGAGGFVAREIFLRGSSPIPWPVAISRDSVLELGAY